MKFNKLLIKGISYDIDNLLLSGTITEDEKDAYKEYFIIALEMIKDDVKTAMNKFNGFKSTKSI